MKGYRVRVHIHVERCSVMLGFRKLIKKRHYVKARVFQQAEPHG